MLHRCRPVHLLPALLIMFVPVSLAEAKTPATPAASLHVRAPGTTAVTATTPAGTPATPAAPPAPSPAPAPSSTASVTPPPAAPPAGDRDDAPAGARRRPRRAGDPESAGRRHRLPLGPGREPELRHRHRRARPRHARLRRAGPAAGDGPDHHRVGNAD